MDEMSEQSNVQFQRGTKENLIPTLHEALCTVTYSSGLAIDSLLNGCPNISMSPSSFAYEIVPNTVKGIEDIRPIDSAKIRKIKEVKTSKDPVTGAKIIENTDEYYIYQEKPGQQQSGVKLTKDSVLYCTSGLLDETQKKIISYPVSYTHLTLPTNREV